MLLRIFFGEKCQDLLLDQAKKFAIGKKPKNGFAVDGADLMDEHIIFKQEKGTGRLRVWVTFSAGSSCTTGGRPIREAWNRTAAFY